MQGKKGKEEGVSRKWTKAVAGGQIDEANVLFQRPLRL